MRCGIVVVWINPYAYNQTIMRRAAHTGDEKQILLVSLLRLVGDYQKILEPLRVTPSQAGVLLAFVTLMTSNHDAQLQQLRMLAR